jgi:hypothetical protein
MLTIFHESALRPYCKGSLTGLQFFLHCCLQPRAAGLFITRASATDQGYRNSSAKLTR